MIVLGVVLLLLGLLLGVGWLWVVGAVLAIVGAVLWMAEGSGAAWGRRWY